MHAAIAEITVRRHQICHSPGSRSRSNTLPQMRKTPVPVSGRIQRRHQRRHRRHPRFQHQFITRTRRNFQLRLHRQTRKHPNIALMNKHRRLQLSHPREYPWYMQCPYQIQLRLILQHRCSRPRHHPHLQWNEIPNHHLSSSNINNSNTSDGASSGLGGMVGKNVRKLSKMDESKQHNLESRGERAGEATGKGSLNAKKFVNAQRE